MFAASSAAGATLQPVARILFIICSVQIMVTTCQNDLFDGPFVGKRFFASQCPRIGDARIPSVEECQDLCLSHRGPPACTAVDYRVSDNYCELWACTLPVPPPAGYNWSAYNAYSLKPDLFDGPFVGKRFFASQCPRIGDARIPSVEECQDLCLSHRGPPACTAVDYRVSDNYCELWACPLPVPPPVGYNWPAYNAYSLKPEAQFDGPFVDKHFLNEQCPPLHGDYAESVAKCLDLCLSHRGPAACTAVNYGGRYKVCDLRACKLPIPPPAGNLPGLNAYSLKPAPKKCGESKDCSKVNGNCIEKMKWKDCGGKLEENWCDGKNCGCCY